ncbi:hypothetical protein ACX8XP_12315 [Calditrichota bacterium LG25]
MNSILKIIKSGLELIRRAFIRLLRLMERITLRAHTRQAESWLVFWLAGLSFLWLWDFFFLNQPAFQALNQAFVNTVFVAFAVVVFAFFQAWVWLMIVHFLEENEHKRVLAGVHFLLNVVRSVPQIVGILFGYIVLTLWVAKGALSHDVEILLLMALFISIFVFLEVLDLLRERIKYFQKLDFYNAMRVCGVSSWRIINYDIIYKNSLAHLMNKAIGVFAASIFLQCSVDFIISVGLSTQVNALNFPVTLGSLLATIDSKQDILAISYTLTHPGYLPNLFFRHLLGISVAFMIIFSLLSLFKITNALAERLER